MAARRVWRGGKIVATEYSFVTPSELEPGASGQFGVVVEPTPIESYEIDLTFVDRSAVPTDEVIVIEDDLRDS